MAFEELPRAESIPNEAQAGSPQRRQDEPELTKKLSRESQSRWAAKTQIYSSRSNEENLIDNERNHQKSFI